MGIFKAHHLKGDDGNYKPGGKLGSIVALLVRLIQVILGITVIGLYAQYLDRARRAHVYQDGKWVFATVTGAVSAFVAMLHFVPRLGRIIWPADVLLWFCWLVVFGIFGKMYITEDPEGDAGVQRMKNAVWIDLINMLLWFLTASAGIALFFLAKRKRTLHTGAAEL
jgi:hypothetical protein